MLTLHLGRLPFAVLNIIPATQSLALSQSVPLQTGSLGSGERSVGPVLRILRPCECLLFSRPYVYLRAPSHTCWSLLLQVAHHLQDRVRLNFVLLSC